MNTHLFYEFGLNKNHIEIKDGIIKVRYKISLDDLPLDYYEEIDKESNEHYILLETGGHAYLESTFSIENYTYDNKRFSFNIKLNVYYTSTQQNLLEKFKTDNSFVGLKELSLKRKGSSEGQLRIKSVTRSVKNEAIINFLWSPFFLKRIGNTLKIQKEGNMTIGLGSLKEFSYKGNGIRFGLVTN